jgi:hypothetical protein
MWALNPQRPATHGKLRRLLDAKVAPARADPDALTR